MNKHASIGQNVLLVGLAIFLLAAWTARADDQVRVYPAPDGEPLSTSYTVTVGQSKSPVYLAKVRTADSLKLNKEWDETAFTSFDFQGNAQVTVTCSGPVKSAKVLPSSSGITPVIAGNDVTFTISKPGQFVLEVNDDSVNSLQLFANPLETDAPHEGNSQVIYFGPGVHEVDEIKVTSGQTLYIAEGAIIYGKTSPQSEKGAVIDVKGDNITIRGRGIIDGSRCPFHTKNLIYVHDGSNISIEGVTLRDSSTWNMPVRRCRDVKIKNVKIFGYRGNSDGIDLCNCTNADVCDSFLRTFDDLIVVKTDKGQGESHDITAENCVLWNEIAHALSIGAELREKVEHVHFSNCDVIHDKGREWVLRVYNCDSAHIRDVTFDDIRIEESRRLISLWIGKAVWSKEDERGHIDDTVFRNIRATGANPLVELKGFDADHVVKGTLFEDVTVNGQQLKPSEVKQNEFVQDVSVKP